MQRFDYSPDNHDQENNRKTPGLAALCSARQLPHKPDAFSNLISGCSSVRTPPGLRAHSLATIRFRFRIGILPNAETVPALGGCAPVGPACVLFQSCIVMRLCRQRCDSHDPQELGSIHSFAGCHSAASSLAPARARSRTAGRLHASRWRCPSWRRLSYPAVRPGSRRGPRFLGAPLRLPGAPRKPPWGPGAPSASSAHPVLRPGPAHFGSSADPRLLRAFSPPVCAPPLRLPPAIACASSASPVASP